MLVKTNSVFRNEMNVQKALSAFTLQNDGFSMMKR